MPPEIRLAITPGDPLGIGPEITVKFLAWQLPKLPNHHVAVYGCLAALESAAKMLHLALPQSNQITYHDATGKLPGEISYNALEQAAVAVINGEGDALVTGPIAKSHLKEAGILASGHTELLEFFAKRAWPEQKHKAEMLFLYRNFRMLLLTRHIPLSRVSQELLAENLRQPMTTLCGFLKNELQVLSPHVAVMGVNPHAGEVGGVEEELVLQPLMKELSAEGLAEFEGPFAADALFRGFDIDRVPYDCYVAAYHDQGLIPFKLVAGHKAVNVTIGLPFIRTSVGHGTAFDIAGKGIATEESLVAAVETASALVKAGWRQPVLP